MAAASQINNKLGEQLAGAKRLHLAGELKLAQKKYEKLLKKMPDNPVVLSLLGGLLLQRKQYFSTEWNSFFNVIYLRKISVKCHISSIVSEKI